MAEGRIGFEPGAAFGSTPQAGHLGRDGVRRESAPLGSFLTLLAVDKHQPIRLKAHPRHPAVLPLVSGGAQPFCRNQRFVGKTIPVQRANAPLVPLLTRFTVI